MHSTIFQRPVREGRCNANLNPELTFAAKQIPLFCLMSEEEEKLQCQTPRDGMNGKGFSWSCANVQIFKIFFFFCGTGV
jgi:hypothetical protein